MDWPGSCRWLSHTNSWHWDALPLKLSTNAFYVGLPGLMNFSLTPRRCDRRNVAFEMSSGSVVTDGLFWQPPSHREPLALVDEPLPEIEKSAICSTHSRVKSSTTLNRRNRRPLAS